jgi:hypothetical protein
MAENGAEEARCRRLPLLRYTDVFADTTISARQQAAKRDEFL